MTSQYIQPSNHSSALDVCSTRSSTGTKTLQPLKWVQATGVAQGDFYQLQSGFVQMKKTET